MSDILSTLFTIEVIACLVVAGSAAIGVSVVSGYSRDRVPLGKKLRKTERQLEKLRNHIAEKQGAIKQLQAEVEALQPPYDQLLAYHEDLLGIQMAEDRRVAAEEEEHDPKKPRSANPWE